MPTRASAPRFNDLRSRQRGPGLAVPLPGTASARMRSEPGTDLRPTVNAPPLPLRQNLKRYHVLVGAGLTTQQAGRLSRLLILVSSGLVRIVSTPQHDHFSTRAFRPPPSV
jgi:hypothetical protein